MGSAGGIARVCGCLYYCKTADWRKQAIAQACAVCSPQSGSMSEMAMFRQPWRKLKTHKYTSWNQRFQPDV